VIAHEKAKKRAKADMKQTLLADAQIAQYKIKGSEADWNEALSNGKAKPLISVKGSVTV